MAIPVALFTYNRYSHTNKLLSSLKENQYSEQIDLHVFCDGPKENCDSETIKQIEEVRKLVKAQNWCNRLYVYEQKTNKGLANSIVDGITDIIKIYGQLIVLEDDLELAPNTIKYFKEALDFYKDNEEVMSISAYSFPALNTPKNNDDYCFLKLDSSWGWATWERAWLKFSPDCKAHKKKLNEWGQMNDFDFSSNLFSKMLDLQIKGEIDSWAISWYASIYLNNGLTLFPKKSFTNNTGKDGTGTHNDATTAFYNAELNSQTSFKFPKEIAESKPHRKMLKAYMQNLYKQPFAKRIWYKLLKLIR